jgi:hypothetical protein
MVRWEAEEAEADGAGTEHLALRFADPGRGRDRSRWWSESIKGLVASCASL